MNELETIRAALNDLRSHEPYGSYAHARLQSALAALAAIEALAKDPVAYRYRYQSPFNPEMTMWHSRLRDGYKPLEVQPLYAAPPAQTRRESSDAENERLCVDAERYRWLCEKLGETQLPTLIERITSGYVADYKPSIDAAIDAAMNGENVK